MTMTAPSRVDQPGRTDEPTPSRRPRRWRLKLIIAFILAVVLAAAVIWVVEFSSAFATKQVAVVGASRIPATEVEATAGVPMGLPLARQDVAVVAARVAAMPQVASASARRVWPDTIRISIVERQPLLGVRQPAGFLIIDKTGSAFEVDGTLPDGVVQADIDPGNASLLADAATVVQAMSANLRNKVDRIATTSENSITVTLTDGTAINWGPADESALKAKIVVALLKQKPHSIDVSSPHNPAVR